ncbi:MAG: DUF448 domain-containing protein [Sphingorhabdus sp.]
MLSGERDSAHALIRLALSPDNVVAPDIHGKAPGRGAWIGVTADELAKAQAKGKLAGVLKRAFKVDKVELLDDMAGRISKALEKAFLDRLGLEARSGNLILGAEKIDTAARSGQVALLLHASDASTDGSGKRDQAWRVGEDAEGSGKGGIKLPVDRDAISAALGRQNAVHVALTDQKAADRVMHHLGRWLNFNGCSNAPLDSVAGTAPDRGEDAISPISDD